MKKIVFAILYSLYISCSQNAFLNNIQDESMQKALKDMIYQIQKINFTSDIKEKKYQKITIDKIAKLNEYFEILHLYMININSKQLQNAFPFLLKELKLSFNIKLINLLIDILENPEEENNPPIFDLLPLAIGPGLTLLDFISFDDEKEKLIEDKKLKINNYYTKLLNGMINIAYGETKDAIDTFFKNRIQNQPTVQYDSKNQDRAMYYYIQQIYNTMSKHNMKIDQNVSSFLNQNNAIINDLNNTFQNDLHKQMQKLSANIIKKTKSFKRRPSSYTQFLYDYDFHADMLTTIKKASENIAFKNNIDTVKTLLQKITTYLNTIQDCKVLDAMQERQLILHYKDYLLLSIKNLVANTKNKSLVDSFKPIEKSITHFSDERMLGIATFVNQWIKKNSTTKILSSSSSARILLFYSDIVENVYKPANNQWEPIDQATKTYLETGNEYLKQHPLDIFNYWQNEIARYYTDVLISLCNQYNITVTTEEQKANLAKQIANFTFSFTNTALIAYCESHYSKEANLKNLVNTILEPNLHNSFDPNQKDAVIIDILEKHATDINFIGWYWQFMKLINKKDVLDIVEGSGIEKTLTALNKAIDTLFTYSFNTKNQKINNAINQLLEKMNALKNAIFGYLKSVLYTQNPNRINEAYIKTGHALIQALEKTVAEYKKKRPEQELKAIQNFNKNEALLPNLKALDNLFEAKKAFIL
ncbi:hypothetical protein EKK58_03225 [Candidatus Dependentiae bacterium]|nr:MAG: hypothetical protein EKK58_03225 [Candidatus Dependentiae bacterium]